MTKRNYNPGALMVELGEAEKGSQFDLDDMEVVEELGLDPKLAYTPALNEAALQKQRESHVQDLVRGGYDPKQANRMAAEGMNESRNTIKELLKRRNKQ